MELTIWERITLMDMVGSERGLAGHYYKCAKLLAILDFDEDLKEEIKLTHLTDGRVFWTENEDGSQRLFELEFTTSLLKVLKEVATRYQGWPVDRQGRTGILLEKLEIMDDE